MSDVAGGSDPPDREKKDDEPTPGGSKDDDAKRKAASDDDEGNSAARKKTMREKTRVSTKPSIEITNCVKFKKRGMLRKYFNYLSDSESDNSDSSSDSSSSSSSSTASSNIGGPRPRRNHDKQSDDENDEVTDLLKRPQPKHKWFMIPEILKRFGWFSSDCRLILRFVDRWDRRTKCRGLGILSSERMGRCMRSSVWNCSGNWKNTPAA